MRLGRSLRGPGGQKGKDLERLAQSHFVGEQAVTAHLAEMVHPLDAAPLVGAKDSSGIRWRLGRREHPLAPRLHLGRKRHLEPGVVEKGKYEILQERRASFLRLLNVAPPRAVRLPLLRGQGDDPEVGKDDGWPPRFRSAETSESVSILSPALNIQRRFRPASPCTRSATASISRSACPSGGSPSCRRAR